MDRKKFIAFAISAALGLSGAPVYASESAAFSDGGSTRIWSRRRETGIPDR